MIGIQRTVLIIGVIFFTSCANDVPEAEQKSLNDIISQPVSIDLPPLVDQHQSNAVILPITITADNEYVLENQTYEFDELQTELLDRIDTTKTTKLKISADKESYTVYVFQLIDFCKNNDLSPILVYEDEE